RRGSAVEAETGTSIAAARTTPPFLPSLSSPVPAAVRALEHRYGIVSCVRSYLSAAGLQDPAGTAGNRVFRFPTGAVYGGSLRAASAEASRIGQRHCHCASWHGNLSRAHWSQQCSGSRGVFLPGV